MLCSLSNLNDKELEEINRLEKELGQTLLSFSCHPAQPADLKGDELSRIENVEKELGVVLVAVK